MPDPPHEERFDFTHFLRQQHRGKYRRDRKRGNDRAKQGIRVGARHGPEDLSFHALHREQRQEGGDGNQDREQDRFVDFRRALEYVQQPVRKARLAILPGQRGPMRQMPVDVLEHDHAGVDDDAKIDGSDRKKVGGLATQHGDDHRQEQRDRYRRGHNDCPAQASEKSPLNDEDQRNAEQHVVQHGVDGHGDQVAAIVERIDPHTWWKGAIRVELLDRLANARDNLHGALELLHQHDAEHDVRDVVASGDAEPWREPDLHIGNVGEQHWDTALLGEHDVANILQRLHNTDAADIDRLLAHRDGAAADVGIARRNGIQDLRQSHAVGHHAVEIDLDLELLALAAQHQHVGNTGDGAQPAFHNPVLERLELHQVHAWRALELVAKYLADGSRWRDHRLHA